MSYEQLMEHAREIEDSAVRQAIAAGYRTESSIMTTDSDYIQHQEKFDVIAAFQPFTNIPNPDAFVPMISLMQTAREGLSWGPDVKDPLTNKLILANLKLDSMKNVDRALADWTGVAADEFKRDFIDHFESRLHNQFAVASVLQGALAAHQAVWKSVRTDIDAIAENTLHALDHLGDCNSKEWTVAFTVTACLTAIAAIPATGGASLLFEFVSASAWVAAAAPPNSPVTADIGGNTPTAVISSMHGAITKLAKQIAEGEQTISRILNEAIDKAKAGGDKLVAPQPKLASATAANVTSGQYLGTAS